MTRRRARRAEAERDRLLHEKGRAEALLGLEGAGGSAAGLIPAIHNLAAERDRLREQNRQLAAIATWALEQIKMWWRGVHRNTSDPAAALVEVDRTLAQVAALAGSAPPPVKEEDD